MRRNDTTTSATAKIIGCGHSESLINHNSCILIENEKGRLLIDCGHTTKKALHEQGYSIGDIDAIFITHVHGDHVFGLERFAYESLFKHNKKIRLYFHESLYEELWDQTLKGSLSRIGEGDASFSDYFDVKPISGDTFEELGLRYEIFPVRHTPNKPCYGILVNDRLLYTSDTRTIPEILNQRQFSFVIHDMTTDSSNPVHASLHSIIEDYPEFIRKKMKLISYDDDFTNHIDDINYYTGGLVVPGETICID